MTPLPIQLHPAAARSLELWHAMIARNDLSGLESIVHPDAVFRSPMAINPYRPRSALLLAVQTALTIFKDEVVELGSLDPESVVTPGLFVQRVVPIERRHTEAGGFKTQPAA